MTDGPAMNVKCEEIILNAWRDEDLINRLKSMGLQLRDMKVGQSKVYDEWSLDVLAFLKLI